jgi:hypothetical protein
MVEAGNLDTNLRACFELSFMVTEVDNLDANLEC